MTNIFALLTGIALLVGINISFQNPNKSNENVVDSVRPTSFSDMTVEASPTEKPLLNVTPTPTPSPIAVIINKPPVVDCIGPDGKHLWVTQKVCDDFNNAWKKSSPTPAPTPQNEPKSKKPYIYFPPIRMPHTYCIPNMNGVGQNCYTNWY